LAKASEIPGGFAFLARMRASGASGDAKYLVAWHRPCTQCKKCNKDGFVAFVDRAKPGYKSNIGIGRPIEILIIN